MKTRLQRLFFPPLRYIRRELLTPDNQVLCTRRDDRIKEREVLIDSGRVTPLNPIACPQGRKETNVALISMTFGHIEDFKQSNTMQFRHFSRNLHHFNSFLLCSLCKGFSSNVPTIIPETLIRDSTPHSTFHLPVPLV